MFARCTAWALCLMLVTTCAVSAADSQVALKLRTRIESKPGSGRFTAITKEETWDAKKTAFIVCDMWDLHHCLNATKRGGEVAPRMNEVLKNARERGALIIHAPSSCMETYKEHPARLRAQRIAKSKNLPDQISQWCRSIPSEEKGKYPIDQTDGGEDDDPAEHAAWAKKLAEMGRNPKAPWKSQTDLLTIDGEKDFISDSGEEIWSILEQHARPNVVLLGVHTNMCVLGRPFGLRQLSKNGKHVVLMRDMTDTMYNPERAPFVSHFTGTDLIVEHIEKWVCPTITSDQFIGGKSFVFANDKRPHVVALILEKEYRTNETVPTFALKELGKTCRVSYVFGDEDKWNSFPGIEVLNDADVLLLSVRRQVLPPQQMAVIRKFIESGKPVVGIRTASHAFSLRGQQAPEGLTAWETFDADVFGGNYSNHYGAGPNVTVKVADGAAQHPILAGVDVAKLEGTGSLYVVSPIAKSAKPLLIGTFEGKPSEPIAWTNQTKFGGKSFYTSFGHIGEFDQEPFNKLLSNAVQWAVSK